jgi:LytS/YehU family sensor histidine kinase
MASAWQSALSTKRLTIALGWAIAVVLFAAQWYAYDATRAFAEPFQYYLWWSAYIWALLTPCALWLAWRFPITLRNWPTRVPLHLAASVALTGVQLSLEAYLGWLRRENSLSVSDALRHYFSQHTQISLITYWLLVAAVMLYKSRQEAQQNRLRSAKLESQLAAARLEVLRSQLHPHFLFNTLHAASTLVREDPDRAEDILLRLSDLLRATLHESQIQEISLDRELGVLEAYLAIQTCRFQDRLRFTVDVGPELRQCLVPSLLLQPIVENAVGHGIGAHKGCDTVTIRATRNEGTLRMEIRNSISSLSDGVLHSNGRGFGLAATRERLEQLYGTQRSSFTLTNAEPSGVCATIEIPLRMASEGSVGGEPST